MSDIKLKTKPIWYEGEMLIRVAKQVSATDAFRILAKKNPIDPDDFSDLAKKWLNSVEEKNSTDELKAYVTNETRISLSLMLLYMATPQTDKFTVEWVKEHIVGYKEADIKAVDRMIFCLNDCKKILAGESK